MFQTASYTPSRTIFTNTFRNIKKIVFPWMAVIRARSTRFNGEHSHIKIGCSVLFCNYMSYENSLCPLSFDFFWFLIKIMYLFHLEHTLPRRVLYWLAPFPCSFFDASISAWISSGSLKMPSGNLTLCSTLVVVISLSCPMSFNFALCGIEMPSTSR